ncbi:MFS transporter [Streptomyces sp. NPDC021100]|uniref:MFS transporter n=1 Tax=Streptomyces sp. NPDC021100 TaxID=3365114 RepID=UPI0037B4169C
MTATGAVGDRFGRRRVTLRGATAFGVTSTLATFPAGVETPIAAHALTSVAGATPMPSAVPPVSALFRDAPRRTVTVGARGSGSPTGAGFGPVTGGAPLGRLWWGPVFLLPPPAAPLPVVLLGPPLPPEGRGARPGGLGPPGVDAPPGPTPAVAYGLGKCAVRRRGARPRHRLRRRRRPDPDRPGIRVR